MKKNAVFNTQDANQVLWPVYSHAGKPLFAPTLLISLILISLELISSTSGRETPRCWETEMSHLFKTLCGETKETLTHFEGLYLRAHIYIETGVLYLENATPFWKRFDSETQKGEFTSQQRSKMDGSPECLAELWWWNKTH